MTIPFGGETGLVQFSHGIITVEPTDACSATAPILPGEIFKLAIAGDTAADSSGYKLIPAADEDTTADAELVQALIRCVGGDLSVVRLCVPGQIRLLPYLTGSAPSIGQSVKISATVTKVEGTTWARGKGTVMKVDTATETCEVLF